MKKIALEHIVERGVTLAPPTFLQLMREHPVLASAAIRGLAAQYQRPLTLNDLPEEIRSPQTTLRMLLGKGGDLWKEFFATHPPELLREEIGWFDTNREIAYELLATQYFTAFEQELRNDLAHNFENRHELYV